MAVQVVAYNSYYIHLGYVNYTRCYYDCTVSKEFRYVLNPRCCIGTTAENHVGRMSFLYLTSTLSYKSTRV
jgi:hypothetical protein